MSKEFKVIAYQMLPNDEVSLHEENDLQLLFKSKVLTK